jgi:hypothetical protein
LNIPAILFRDFLRPDDIFLNITLAELAVEEMEMVSVTSSSPSAAAWRSGVLIDDLKRDELLKLRARRNLDDKDFPFVSGGISMGATSTAGSTEGFPSGEGVNGVCCSGVGTDEVEEAEEVSSWEGAEAALLLLLDDDDLRCRGD